MPVPTGISDKAFLLPEAWSLIDFQRSGLASQSTVSRRRCEHSLMPGGIFIALGREVSSGFINQKEI